MKKHHPSKSSLPQTLPLASPLNKSKQSWQTIKTKLHKQQEKKMEEYSKLMRESRQAELKEELENLEVFVCGALWGYDERICRGLCMAKFVVVQEQGKGKEREKGGLGVEVTSVKMERSKYIR